MELDSVKFREYTRDMINIGRFDMAVQLGVVSDKISQRQAKTIYKSKLAIWEKRGLITGDKQGGGNSTIYYSRTELEILDKSEKYE
jgi:hypothetical protein